MCLMIDPSSYIVGVVGYYKLYFSPLNFFKFLGQILLVQVPDGTGILQNWSHETDICRLLCFLITEFEISPK